ncbi:MAG: cysteine peptidase family C39 domain-containing protein [Parcubacteria group bacterium]
MPILLKKIRQSESFCGPASLVSLLDYYGVRISEKELGRLCGTTISKGTEPEDLIRVLKKLGFKVFSKEQGTWSEIREIVSRGTPVLVNWWSDYELPSDGHYSLVYRMTDKSIYLMDPELGGYRRMQRAKFMRQWYDFYANGRRNSRWYLYIK